MKTKTTKKSPIMKSEKPISKETPVRTTITTITTTKNR